MLLYAGDLYFCKKNNKNKKKIVCVSVIFLNECLKSGFTLSDKTAIDNAIIVIKKKPNKNNKYRNDR